MDPSQIIKSDLPGEEGLGHECQDLLLSLPKEKGWRTAHLYQYQDVWYPPKELQAVMAFQQHFQAHDSDLLLVTTPKSGTTWLKALAFTIVNRSRYIISQYPFLDTNPHDLVPFFESQVYCDNQFPDRLAKLSSPRLLATHVPYISLPVSIRTSNCRIVYLCRNPKDTFVSFWHFMIKLRPQTLEPLSMEEGFELFCRGVSGFGPFWDHVLGYWKESLERPQKVLFMKYEEMKEDITSQVKRLAEYLGYPFSLEEENQGVIEEIARVCSFEHLSNLEVNQTGKSVLNFENKNLFRRGEVGDWVNYLTPSMVERLDQVMEQKLIGSGLTFKAS